jgi:hypothetical protein
VATDVKPLLDINCHYDSYCEYPTMVKLTMLDGTVQTYILQNKTEFQFNKVMNCLEKMVTGYKAKKYRRR